MDSPKRLLVLVGSPRRKGNSFSLAEAAQRGAEQKGVHVSLRFIDDYIKHFLKDCRSCRNVHGECSLADDFKTLFMTEFLPADGVIFSSPIYWYGLSAQTKAFFDRTFCYYAASHPKSDAVIKGMTHKRVGLLLSSEETYPGASLGIVHQIQEYARYTHSEFIGVVRGFGNSRGEVQRDPRNPLIEAQQFGESFFSQKFTDYRIDTERSGRVWGSSNMA